MIIITLLLHVFKLVCLRRVSMSSFPSCWQTLKAPQFIAESAKGPNKRAEKTPTLNKKTILFWGWNFVVHKLTWRVKGIHLRSVDVLIKFSPSKLKLGFCPAGVQTDPVWNEAQNEKPNLTKKDKTQISLLEDLQPASSI